jgi:hypothetical protein
LPAGDARRADARNRRTAIVLSALPDLTLVRSPEPNLDVLVVGLSDTGLVGVPEVVNASYAQRYGLGVLELATSLGAKATPGWSRC